MATTMFYDNTKICRFNACLVNLLPAERPEQQAQASSGAQKDCTDAGEPKCAQQA